MSSRGNLQKRISFQAFHQKLTPTSVLLLVAIIATAVPSLFAQKSGESERDDPKARAEYLEKKRGGPAPPGARQRALKEVDGMLEREGKAYWDSVSKADSASRTERTGA